MKVFLTGATGFIGQALVRAMGRRAWTVSALVRDPGSAPARWLAARGVRLVSGDVVEPQGLRAALAGADALLHNAGVYEYGPDARLVARMRAVNVDGTAHVLAAAREAGIGRTLYVSTVWAMGVTGSEPRDEQFVRQAPYLSHYERSKADAHAQALAERARGLPLTIAMPNGVVGANDHAVFGYLLRLYLMHRLPVMSWGADSIYSFVDVDALAEGLCLALERAPMGEDYLFCGEPHTLRELFGHWARHPGGAKRLIYVPRWVAWPQMALLEPLERAFGLPAFLSRETVDIGVRSLNYSAAKAQRELGWTHPAPAAMWDRIVAAERELITRRQGFLNRLRPVPVVED